MLIFMNALSVGSMYMSLLLDTYMRTCKLHNPR